MDNHPQPNNDLDGHPTPPNSKDDIVEEDDLGAGSGLIGKENKDESKDTKGEHPDRDRDPPQEPNEGQGDGSPPPPTPNRLVEILVPTSGPSNGGTTAVSGTTRAELIGKKYEPKKIMERKAVASNMYNFITVNGVKVENSKMLRKDNNMKTTPNRKKMLKKNNKKLTTTTPPVNKISEYFSRRDNTNLKTTPVKTAVKRYEVRCTEGEESNDNTEDRKVVTGRHDKSCEYFEDETKTTFSTITPKKNMVKKKIEELLLLTKNDNKCLIGSGRCAKHNTRVTRVIEKKRVSTVNKDGSISWKMCEVAILSCPAVSTGASSVSSDCLYTELSATNKRQRTLLPEECNQLALSTTKKNEVEDLPLDND